MEQNKQLISEVVTACMKEFQPMLTEVVVSLTDRFTAELKEFRDCLEKVTATTERLAERLALVEGHVTAVAEAPMRKEKALNLVGVGLPEPVAATHDLAAQSDHNHITAIAETLNIHPEAVIKVFRHGRPRDDGRPRILKVKFRDSDSRRRFLNGGRGALQGYYQSAGQREVKAYFRPDLTPSELEEQARLNSALWQRRNAGEDVIIYRSTIIPRADRDAARSRLSRPTNERQSNTNINSNCPQTQARTGASNITQRRHQVTSHNRGGQAAVATKDNCDSNTGNGSHSKSN